MRNSINRKAGKILGLITMLGLAVGSPLHAAQQVNKGAMRILDIKEKQIGRQMAQAMAAAKQAVSSQDMKKFEQAKNAINSAYKTAEDFQDSGIGKLPEVKDRIEEIMQKVSTAFGEIYQAAEPLLEKQLADKKLESDAYQGGDLEELRKKVADAWKERWPKDEVLAVRFPTNDWKQTKVKRWNDAVKEWQFTDTSALMAQVVVKQTEKIATIFPAFINKRNDENTMNIGVYTKYGSYVTSEIPVVNVK